MTNKISSYPYLTATLEDGSSFYIKNTPENVAAFIVKDGIYHDITITTPLDEPVINTKGPFIDTCANVDYLKNTLNPVLIPMQMCEVETPDIKYYEYGKGKEQQEVIRIQRNHGRR